MPNEIHPIVSVFDVKELQSFLETLDAVDAAIVLQALFTLLPKGNNLKPGWIKHLPNEIRQLRLGPTRHKVLRILPELPDLQGLPDQPMLLRVYFTFLGEQPFVLCAYNKGLNHSRDTQKQSMALAVERKNILSQNLDK